MLHAPCFFMSDFIIRVENLGKKYKIRHQQDRQRYVALRDVIAEKAAAPLRWLRQHGAWSIEHGATDKHGVASNGGPSPDSQLSVPSSELVAPDSSLPASGSEPVVTSGAEKSEIRNSNFEISRILPAPGSLLPAPSSKLQAPSSVLPAPSSLLHATSEEFWALRGVSFEVKQGEVLGIIGRNGAGKTTLLKILSRITEPTEGRVRIRGRVASLLEVGTGFHPELTGRENIFLNGAVLGMTRAEVKNKFDEIVAFADVEKFLDTPVKRYSSGMYVRLAFAVAAHLEPEILIVDEVLAVGDASFQKKCLGKMSDVAHGGRTVLFVSHNMAAIQTLCGSGILLDGGCLQEFGSIDSVIHGYLAGPPRPRSGSVGIVPFGKKLLLRCLSFTPEIVVSGKSADFRVEFLSREPVRLRGAAILIYTELGTRIAVIDLRQTGLRDIEVCETGLMVEGRIHALPLVEGDYRIGLYIATDEHQDNYLDLAMFSVMSRVSAREFVPYAAFHRGLVELEFAARVVKPVTIERVCL